MTEYQQDAPPRDGGGQGPGGPGPGGAGPGGPGPGGAGPGGPGPGGQGPGGQGPGGQGPGGPGPGGPGPGGPGGPGGGAPAGSYAQAHGEGVGTGGQQHVRVLDEGRSQDLRNRWNGVQAAFVDEPRQAVTDADQLVGEVLDEVSRVFREQRAGLEKGWGEQNEPGTEDLRQALFRYREFFDRLLSL